MLLLFQLLSNEVGMNKTRGLLLLVTLLTLAGQILILHSHLHNNLQFTLHVADGILLLSALTMLLFSFFRVGVTACGDLCYNPDNWYWKTMKEFSDSLYAPYSSPFDRGEVSLCKAFWLTVFAVFMVIVLSALAVSLFILLWDVYWKFGLLKIILFAFGIVAFIGVIIGIVFASEKVKVQYDQIVDDKPRLRNAMETIGNILGVLLFIDLIFFIVVVVPVIIIMEKAKVSLYVAVIYYLIGVFGLTLTIGGAWLLIWGTFWYLPRVMRGSVLEQFLSAKKKQFCPTLVACKLQ